MVSGECLETERKGERGKDSDVRVGQSKEVSSHLLSLARAARLRSLRSAQQVPRRQPPPHTLA